MIIIEQPGPLAVIEDLGRPGWSGIGVSPSGAADRSALRLANRLVGNPEHYAGIEITFGGFAVSCDRPLWCAVTGAPGSVLVNDRPDGSHHSLRLEAGDTLRVPAPEQGLRNYLAVRGGISVEPVLGSRSTDLLSGLGPSPLAAGDQLPIGSSPLPLPPVNAAPQHRPPDGPLRLPLGPGPRADWFAEQSLASLLEQVWSVGTDSDRTAVRLEGVGLQRRPDAPAELPSEGVLRGAVQVPPSGQPLIFGSNHPVTGGYPVIGVVPAAAVDRAAQLRPGDAVRFDPVGGRGSRLR